MQIWQYIVILCLLPMLRDDMMIILQFDWDMIIWSDYTDIACNERYVSTYLWPISYNRICCDTINVARKCILPTRFDRLRLYQIRLHNIEPPTRRLAYQDMIYRTDWWMAMLSTDQYRLLTWRSIVQIMMMIRWLIICRLYDAWMIIGGNMII